MIGTNNNTHYQQQRKQQQHRERERERDRRQRQLQYAKEIIAIAIPAGVDIFQGTCYVNDDLKFYSLTTIDKIEKEKVTIVVR